MEFCLFIKNQLNDETFLFPIALYNIKIIENSEMSLHLTDFIMNHHKATDDIRTSFEQYISK